MVAHIIAYVVRADAQHNRAIAAQVAGGQFLGRNHLHGEADIA